MKLFKLHMDVYTGGILAFIGLYFFIEASKFTEQASTFPKIVLGTFIMLSLMLVVEGLVKSKKLNMHSDAIKFEEIKIPLVIFTFITLYVIALNLIGFYISTLIFIPSIMLFYKQRKKIIIACSTIGVVLFIHLLFVVQLKLMLP